MLSFIHPSKARVQRIAVRPDGWQRCKVVFADVTEIPKKDLMFKSHQTAGREFAACQYFDCLHESSKGPLGLLPIFATLYRTARARASIDRPDPSRHASDVSATQSGIMDGHNLRGAFGDELMTVQTNWVYVRWLPVSKSGHHLAEHQTKAVSPNQ